MTPGCLKLLSREYAVHAYDGPDPSKGNPRLRINHEQTLLIIAVVPESRFINAPLLKTWSMFVSETTVGWVPSHWLVDP